MKIKNGFVLEEVGGSYLAIAVGDRAEEYRVLIKLNSTGAFLWKRIADADMDEAALTDALLSAYDVDRERALADVETFVTALRRAGLLDE